MSKIVSVLCVTFAVFVVISVVTYETDQSVAAFAPTSYQTSG